MVRVRRLVLTFALACVWAQRVGTQETGRWLETIESGSGCLSLFSFAVRPCSVCCLQNNTTQKSLDYLRVHEPDVLLISLTQTIEGEEDRVDANVDNGVVAAFS